MEELFASNRSHTLQLELTLYFLQKCICVVHDQSIHIYKLTIRVKPILSFREILFLSIYECISLVYFQIYGLCRVKICSPTPFQIGDMFVMCHFHISFSI